MVGTCTDEPSWVATSLCQTSSSWKANRRREWLLWSTVKEPRSHRISWSQAPERRSQPGCWAAKQLGRRFWANI